MPEENDKKVRITSLISDRDRLIYAQETKAPSISATPSPKRDLKKEVLADILNRIEQRNAEIRARKRTEQQS